MARNGILCADMLLRNSLSHSTHRLIYFQCWLGY